MKKLIPNKIEDLSGTEFTVDEFHSREWRWMVFLSLLPFVYFAVLILPTPLGLGLHAANDFYGNRLSWAQCTAYFMHHGHVPLWNSLESYGAPGIGYHGSTMIYPFAWWINVALQKGGAMNFWAEYLQISLHMSWGLSGMYFTLRKFAKVDPAAAVLGSSILLINQRFNESLQYANTIETWSWVPWMVFFGLSLSTQAKEQLVAKPRVALGAMLAFGLCCGMCGLAGYPHLAYVGALFVGLVCLLTLRSIRAMGYLAGGGLLGMVIASPFVISLAVLLNMIPERAGGHIEFAAQFPLTFSYLTLFAKPFSVDALASVYFPPVYLLLAGVGGVMLLRSPYRIGLAMFAGFLLMADLSRGLEGLTFRFFYEHVPFYSGFRIQGRNNWIGLIGLAWFVGLGSQWTIRNGGRRWILLGLIALMSAFLVRGFISDPFVGPSFSPYALHPKLLETGTLLSILLTAGAGLVVLLYLAVDRLDVRIATMVLLIGLFVTSFAQYASWYTTYMVRYGKIAPADAFPSGVLDAVRSYEGDPSRLLHPKGFNALNSPVALAYKTATGGSTQFPATRFAATVPMTLTLVRWTPSIIDIDVDTEDAGSLLHLASYSPFWKANVPLRQGRGDFSQFKVLEVKGGKQRVELRFRPTILLVAASLSWLAVVGCGAGLLMLLQKPRWMMAFVVCSIIPVIVFSLGAFNPEGLSADALYGVDRVTLDPTGQVPLISVEF